MKRPRRSNSSNIHYNLDSGDSDFEERIKEDNEHTSPRQRDLQRSKRKRESFTPPQQHESRRSLRRGRRSSGHILHESDSSNDNEQRADSAPRRRSSVQMPSRIVRINVRAPVDATLPSSEDVKHVQTTNHKPNASELEQSISSPLHPAQQSDASSTELNTSSRARRLRQAKAPIHESDSDDKLNHSRRGDNSRRKPSIRHAKHIHRSDEDDYVEESDDLDDAEITTDDSLTSIDDVKDFVVNDDDEKRVRRKRPRRRTAPRSSNGRTTRRSTRRVVSGEDDISESGSIDDLQAELDEIRSPVREVRQRKLRDRTNRPDYAIPPPLTEPMAPVSHETASRPITALRNLYPTYSSLGLGITGLGQQTFGNFGPPTGLVSESDSSDEEGQTSRIKNSAADLATKTTLQSSELATIGSTNIAKAKGSKLADADPIGVDMSIDFDSVGGLSEHVNQLKEMVSLPLLYPEIFERFHITPPRGVLFHGPPGTGKTLMARALAASCSSEGRKISFYMRKGADCLSKWVGEAERQLRLLFEEARNNQPSIIFFDEIDGLAPVRSAKQDQIHASIVSTLLALMDGMDSRGQVVVIGATNRPDSVDPALRRPGRFDREFYFPLPALEARRQILDIHTNKWSPPLEADFKQQLALQTKGYGGADIRALCTEAALNAVQRKYPQIYVSKDKLVINPAKINVSAKDFMLAIKKIVPSSARTTSSGAAILPDHLKPLLSKILSSVVSSIDSLVSKPQAQNTLEHNLKFEDGDTTFEDEAMHQILQDLKVYRPTLMITGPAGCGQQHIGRAILHHLEGYHVQMLDIAMLYGSSTNTPEAAIVQVFVEAKRHKPSVICLMQLEIWSASASDGMITTLKSLVSSINPHDSILLLGIASVPAEDLSPAIEELFGFSERSVELGTPTEVQRKDFLGFLGNFIARRSSVVLESQGQIPRVLEDLPLAPPPLPRQITRLERKAIEDKDRKLKLVLKAKLSPLLELLKARFKRFKKAAIDEKDIYNNVRSETAAMLQAIGSMDYERTADDMVLERATGKKFYNTDINLIEERLWSNLYLTPKQFQIDIEHILHDVLQDDTDRERVLRAKEMHTTVLLHLEELFDVAFQEECKEMALREIERHRKYAEKQETLRQAEAEESQKIMGDALSNIPGSEALQGTNSLQPVSTNGCSDDVKLATVQQDVDMVDVMSSVVDSSIRRKSSADGIPMPNMPQSPIAPSASAVPKQSVPAHAESIVPVHFSRSPPNSTEKSNRIDGAAQESSGIIAQMPSATLPTEHGDAPAEECMGMEECSADPYMMDVHMLQNFTHVWAKATSGFTVDQLERLNSIVIDRLWGMRSDGNRDQLALVANDVILQMCKKWRTR